MAELRENLFGVAVSPDYIRFLKERSSIYPDLKFQSYHSALCEHIRAQVVNSDIWNSLIQNLREWDDQYKIAYKHDLLSVSRATIHIKPLKSLIEKSYRNNMLNNSRYPEEPVGGWLLPDNWYCKVSDLVRTTLVVKYLDGIEWLSDKILEMSHAMGLDAKVESEATVEGYYAYHVEIRIPVTIHDMNFNEINDCIRLEIQITTQIKDALKEILHSFYVESRVDVNAARNWMWDYRSNRFVANNLGHLLHYVDGMIVQVREKNGG